MGSTEEKTSTYKDFVINKPRPNEFYSEGTNITVADDASHKSQDYWDTNRHEKLTDNEIAVYHMVGYAKVGTRIQNLC